MHHIFAQTAEDQGVSAMIKLKMSGCFMWKIAEIRMESYLLFCGNQEKGVVGNDVNTQILSVHS